MVEVFTAHKARAVKQSFIDSWQSAIQALSKPNASACLTTSTLCKIGSRWLIPSDNPTFISVSSPLLQLPDSHGQPDATIAGMLLAPTLDRRGEQYAWS